MEHNNINIVIIGLGHHAKRMNLDFRDTIKHVNLVGVVDIESNKENIINSLKEKNIDVPTIFMKNLAVSDTIDSLDEDILNKFIKDLKCNSVIISTEPLAHFKYVIWALKNNLNILLDKPITTEVNVSIDVDKAKKLASDYEIIKREYKKALSRKNIVFILQAQRRFHSGFIHVKKRLEEIYDLTNCPVTSIQAFHSDGQWRFPDEIVNIDYHSYNQNYGKVSHSGYHSLDISLRMCDFEKKIDKRYSSFEVYSKFSRPYDFVNQIKYEDYNYFFKDQNINNSYLRFRKDLNIEGEIDAFNSISLFNKNNALITHIASSMLHNGFSQRGWAIPNIKDLYKGNGRVRHESYIIEQGPFQSIIINSFQSKELLKNTDTNHSKVGGEAHFDVHIFRNSSLFKNLKPYELFKMEEKIDFSENNYSRGHNEDARRICIEEFILSIKYNKSPEQQNSNFFEHELSTKVLSAIYESASKDFNNKNMVVKKKI